MVAQEYREEDDQAKCLADKIMADILGLESRMTPAGYYSFFFIMTT